MKLIDINSLKSPGGEAATFQGFEHKAKVSFFIVRFPTGKGPKKHRHPYEETFIILDGAMEAMIDDQAQTIGSPTIVVIPANTWHEFQNRSEKILHTVNIHPVPKMITE